MQFYLFRYFERYSNLEGKSYGRKKEYFKGSHFWEAVWNVLLEGLNKEVSKEINTVGDIKEKRKANVFILSTSRNSILKMIPNLSFLRRNEASWIF